MNPWLLAGLVFGVIGLVQSAVDAADKEKKGGKTPITPPIEAKKPKVSPVSVVVNSPGTGTESAKKPSGKVPKQPTETNATE